MSKFYITTPLYYVNDEPHIGHAYTTILADVISRFRKNHGDDVFFLTGTDEHGQKVQEAANKRNVSPKDHVNEYVVRFKKVWEKLVLDQKRMSIKRLKLLGKPLKVFLKQKLQKDPNY